MDQGAFSEYLENRYKSQMSWYDKKSKLNQKIYIAFQWPLLILSAATPVLVGINIELLQGLELRQAAVITSLCVAILTTAIHTFKYHENWIAYRAAHENLKREIHYYTARVGEYNHIDDREALFVERIERYISSEYLAWQDVQKSNPANVKDLGTAS